MGKATDTWEEMAARGRELAVEQGIDPEELRTTDPEEIAAQFLAEHSPSMVRIGDEIMLTYTWEQPADKIVTTDWFDLPEDIYGPEDDPEWDYPIVDDPYEGRDFDWRRD